MAAAAGILDRKTRFPRLSCRRIAQSLGCGPARAWAAGPRLDGQFARNARNRAAPCRCPDRRGGRPGMSTSALTVSLAPSVGSFDAGEWNALGGNRTPFVAHEFLTALEASGSVGEGTGWQPAPLAISDGKGELLAALPAYVKTHSQGAYVFEHAWADAWQ